MRSYRCFDAVVDPVNLWGAWRDFQRGKRRRPDVAAFSLVAEREILMLARTLQSDSWRPGGYRLLRISDPKRRIVAAAPVVDRVVHHAVHRVLSPLLNRSFIEHSYACLEGRGVQRALLHAQRATRSWGWVLHLDVARFFYEIDREQLAALILPRLRERAMGALIERILDSGAGLYAEPAIVAWLGWDAPQPPGRGLPIGNLTSQWWGNLYLDGLDHHIQRTLRPGVYQRYMDDFLMFDDDRGRLLDTRHQIAAWLAEERGLRLKDPTAEPVTTRAPFIYLGHRLSQEQIAPGPRARQRLTGRLRAHARDPQRLEQALRSYAALWLWGT